MSDPRLFLRELLQLCARHNVSLFGGDAGALVWDELHADGGPVIKELRVNVNGEGTASGIWTENGRERAHEVKL